MTQHGPKLAVPDADLLDLLLDRAPYKATRGTILVDDPSDLYRFR
jgi:hypothetical protein